MAGLDPAISCLEIPGSSPGMTGSRRSSITIISPGHDNDPYAGKASPAKNRLGLSSSIDAMSAWFTPRSCSIGRKSVNI